MIFTILSLAIGIVVYVVCIVKSYNRESTVVFGGMALLVWILISLIPVYLIGFHYEIGKGEHVGYVTAIQRQGVFFKTGRAYVKTDIQSSQEDAYCVIDQTVYSDLQKYAEAKSPIKISYFSWLFSGIKNCYNENDIIYKVEPINSL